VIQVRSTAATPTQGTGIPGLRGEHDSKGQGDGGGDGSLQQNEGTGWPRGWLGAGSSAMASSTRRRRQRAAAFTVWLEEDGGEARP